MTPLPDSFALRFDKAYLPPISFWPGGKVNPIDGATLLKEQLVEVLLLLVGNADKGVHQMNGMLRPTAADIDGTTSHVEALLSGFTITSLPNNYIS